MSRIRRAQTLEAIYNFYILLAPVKNTLSIFISLLIIYTRFHKTLYNQSYIHMGISNNGKKGGVDNDTMFTPLLPLK